MGRGATKQEGGGGGHVKFYPYEKCGGGGRQKFWGSCYAVA